MDYELQLTTANRRTLAEAFQSVKRVDLSIDCILEGTMGRAFVNNPEIPTAFRITSGPFWYFAGDPESPGARGMMKELPAYALLMPSGPGWLELAMGLFAPNLQPFSRYSFSAAKLSTEHLSGLLLQSGYGERVIPIDASLADQITSLPESYLELEEFGSIKEFLNRGLGYTILDGKMIMGVAYSSLACSTGIEVSIYVEETYRRQGIATTLATRLLLESLQRGLKPNWDAANPESCSLALKLGYTFLESYDAFYHSLQ